MNKKLTIATGLLSIVCAFGLFGCGGEEPPTLGGDYAWSGKEQWMAIGTATPTEALVMPTEDKNHRSASVHDPSVYYDEVTSTYYAFGTHFAVAKSTDLIEWTQVSSDYASGNLYGTTSWRTVLADSIEELGGKYTDSTWAPDVVQIDNTYYMYYSLTKDFGSRESVIGRVSSNKIMGPYSNNEIILSSVGGSGNDPNCIDPELFYDKEGKLWMVYGSWNGGIYVKELNATGEKAGLPVEGENGLHDYGTMVWKRGYANGVEGPFIYYNAELDYYYLMISEGDLNSVYNMRVARSKTPNGPYTDITDTDVATTQGRGNKVAGNFRFAGETMGYGALGHNSVIKVDGKYFCVYHTRYANGDTVNGGGHNLYVNQIYFNEDGWPVMSPNRYIGESKGTVTTAQLAGDYDIVVHNIKTEAGVVNSVKYTLKSDGTIVDGENASAGTWSLKDNYYVTMTLGEITYKGVVCAGWRSADSKSGAILSITAVSTTGNPLWAKAVLA